MPTTAAHVSRFATLSDFFERPEELATVEELAAIGPWAQPQLRFWLYEADRNGLETALIRPNARRLYIHSGKFQQWLKERTATVCRERSLSVG